jgi:8-oxo-dGTP pyrophosphatase MutT (NUDIX family)
LELRGLEYPVKGDAAVLIPVLTGNREPELLLTKRTETVSTHKGQISFPGGVREASDGSLVETALREAEEELSLDPSQVEVVGRFHDYLSVTELRVAPFVGFVKDCSGLNPSPAEVQEVLRVPMKFFRQTVPRVEVKHRLGQTLPVYYYDYGEEIIWGLTALIIRDFLELLGE